VTALLQVTTGLSGGGLAFAFSEFRRRGVWQQGTLCRSQAGRRSLSRLNSWVLSLLGSLLLKHGQDIASGVLEPRYQWPTTAKDSLFVCFEVAFVALEAHAALC
jgi:hypothetical protein